MHTKWVSAIAALTLTIGVNFNAQAVPTNPIADRASVSLTMVNPAESARPETSMRLAGLFGNNSYTNCLGNFIAGVNNDGEILHGRVNDTWYLRAFAGFYGSFLCTGPRP